MESPSCFKCDNSLKSDTARCSQCGWNGGVGLEENDDRYLVLLALVYRTIEEGTKVQPGILRIDGTSRELAVLSHGDQCAIDGAKWRITGKNNAAQSFFMKGFRVIQFPIRRFYEFEANDPVDDIREEMKRWKHLDSAYYEMRQLKKRRELGSYLVLPERKKAIYRSQIQDESPYLN